MRLTQENIDFFKTKLPPGLEIPEVLDLESWGLVVTVRELQKVFAEKGRWTDQEEKDALVTHSQLTFNIVGSLRPLPPEQRIKALELQTLFTAKTLFSAKKRALRELDSFLKDNDLPDEVRRAVVLMTYWARILQLHIQTNLSMGTNES